MLRLRTFGGASVCRLGQGGEAAESVLLQRRALALLALVAAGGSDGLSRDKLLAYLWSESDQDKGRNALRQVLHTLRRNLMASDLFLGGEVLQINPGVLACDVREFEAALLARAWGEAATAYQGPFLDGFHIGHASDFEHWVDERRSWYTTQAQDAVRRLADEADRRGDAESAVAWWRRLTVLDPLNARAAAGLMRALASAGNAVGALQAARVFELMVKEELGVPADASVTALAERIRLGLSAPPVQPLPSTVGGPGQRAGGTRSGSFLARLEANLVGRYRIDRELERGGSGQTRSVLGYDLRHDRAVVLKVLHPSLASQIDTERFMREIRVTARLRHPHFLPLLDSGELDGRLWYSVPYSGGETLRERLTRRGALPVGEAVGIMSELAGAVDHAHRNGVIHRDITPENVLLADGHAMLTNLGLARALDAAASPRLTESGAIIGTPAYMSPEQAEGRQDIDGRSDQFSLGCILYELIAGEPLYSGPTPQSIMAKRRMDPRPLVRVLPDVPLRVQESLLKTLALDPTQRFDSTAAFGDALVQDPPDGAPHKMRLGLAGGRHEWKPRHLIWAAAGLAAALAMLSLLRANW